MAVRGCVFDRRVVRIRSLGAKPRRGGKPPRERRSKRMVVEVCWGSGLVFGSCLMV